MPYRRWANDSWADFTPLSEAPEEPEPVEASEPEESSEPEADESFARRVQNSTVKELREALLAGELDLEAVLAAEAAGRNRAGVKALANELA